MNKLLGLLVGFAILASLIMGSLLSDTVRELRASDEELAARARAAAASAARQEQIAEQERARTASAWLEAEAARQSLDARVTGRRWMHIGLGVASAVVLVGAALAAVTFANLRARVIYPDKRGQWPILVYRRRWGSQLLIADTGRGMGPVMLVDDDARVHMPLPASEASALQLATQAQAGSVMVGIAGEGDARQIAERVGRASGALPAPTFAQANGNGGHHFVYVRKRATESKANRDLLDLRDVITRAGVLGLSRRAWLGKRLDSGHKMTRSRYDDVIRKLDRAGVIRREGQTWTLAVSEAEALDAFGIGSEDAEN